METQSTQHGLMQIFSALGVAADTKLSSTGDLETQGFSSLLSGLLPGDSGQPLPLEDEGLPHLGQVLPLELLTPNSLGVSSAAANLGVLNPEVSNNVGFSPDASNSDVSNADVSNAGAFNTGASLLLSPAAETENIPEVSAVNDQSSNLLEQQGFYAQSLVSSLIDQKTVSSNGNTLTATGIATESSKTAPAMSPYLNQGTATGMLSASELEAEANINDRFLGSESTSPLGSPKKSTLELMATPQTPVTLNSPSAPEASINFALALNEDPTSQSLDELIDGEVLEKGEFEAKSNSLERKQDDQTLKLTKGQQAWGDALTERITMNAAKDIKQVTIHLDPPELGSLELKLHIKDDQQTQVHVQVQNHQVKEALESSAHRLRDMLAGQGLELSEFDVQADSGRGDQSYDSEQRQGEGQAQDSDASQNAGNEISVEIAKPKNNNLLDTFV